MFFEVTRGNEGRFCLEKKRTDQRTMRRVVKVGQAGGQE